VTSVKSILINTAILGVLVFAMMSFIITVQVDNSVSSEDRITNNPTINDSYGDLEIALESQQASAQSASDAFEEIPPSESIGDLDISSTISATRTARSIIVGLFNIYITLPMVILGVSPIVASVISTILLIFIVIGIWAVWKGAIT